MPNIDLLSNSLTTWYQQPVGCELAALEVEQLNKLLANLPGQNLLQLSNWELLNHIQNHRLRHRILAYSATETCHQSNGIQCCYTSLPFSNESMDIILLPHILEFETTAHAILDEAWRVLAPDGHLIILGFNPWSLWGLWHLFNPQCNPPWNGHFHSIGKWYRQIDHLEGEVVSASYMFFRPPVNQQSFLLQSHWLDKTIQILAPTTGGAYMLVAKKTTIPFTAIKPSWNWRESLILQKGLEPTTRGVRRG